jgi:hypothetical protein
MFLMNHIDTIILSQSLKVKTFKQFEKICKENVGIQILLYENDIVCFVLKGPENLPARGHKTEKNITLALSLSMSSACNHRAYIVITTQFIIPLFPR